jgi:molybdate transport system substrate-binding protein
MDRRSLLIGLAGLAAAPALARAQGTGPLMFAAASLQDVMPRIAQAFAAAGGAAPRFSFGASSALARQIEQGAPADLVFSADLDWMDYLDQRRLIVRASRRNVLANTLVLVAPTSSSVRLPIRRGFPLARALGTGRLAIADPAAVPAGRYARAALEALGVWASVQDKLAPADNVRGALAFVARGETPFGIVYATDALAEPRVRVVAAFPARSHPAIVYPAALTARTRLPAAGAFLGFLQTPTAAQVFRRAGFGVLPRPR